MSSFLDRYQARAREIEKKMEEERLKRREGQIFPVGDSMHAPGRVLWVTFLAEPDRYDEWVEVDCRGVKKMLLIGGRLERELEKWRSAGLPIKGCDCRAMWEGPNFRVDIYLPSKREEGPQQVAATPDTGAVQSEKP